MSLTKPDIERRRFGDPAKDWNPWPAFLGLPLIIAFISFLDTLLVVLGYEVIKRIVERFW